MKTELKLKLEKAINEFLEEACEHELRPDGYIYPELVEHMTTAAEIVFDAGFTSSQFTLKELE